MTTTRAEGFTREDLEAFPRDPGRSYELVDGVIVISAPGGLTRADRDALPDIGARQEVIDGVLVVSAAPRPRHQIVAFALARILFEAAPAGVDVLPGPIDVALDEEVVFEPDVVVAPRAAFTETGLPTAPLLSVEVLSPSTRRRDLGVKRQRLAAAGCPSYWIVDPGDPTHEPTLTVLEIDGSEYAEVAVVTGGASWTAERPFPVTVVPSRLIDG